MTTSRSIFILSAVLILTSSVSTNAQEAALTFTSEQAEAGRRAYQSECVMCHGENLNDGPLGKPLKGIEFMNTWGGKPVSDLFIHTLTTMPIANPGSLSAETVAALTALMLQENDIVPGSIPLPGNPRLLQDMILPAGGFSFMDFSSYTPRTLVELPNPLNNFTPVSESALANPPAGDWLTWRRGWDAQAFSPLNEINPDNVNELRLAWSWTLPAGSAEGVPIVRDGTLFVQGYGDTVQALNAETGDILWQYIHILEPGASPFHKRGLTLYGDKLYFGTSDVHIVALHARTGEIAWDTRVGDFTLREGLNGGPVVAQGKVMVGTTGTGVGAKPGGPQIVGLDAETGEELWRLGTIARPGDEGGESWNGVPFLERSGASVWTPGSYSPETGLAYFGTGNTYDTGPLLLPNETPGVTNAALFTNSTLAVNPENGELVWYYQHFPNDQWDLDWAFERQIIDLPQAGGSRKAVITAGKIGIYEALDAYTGEFLFAIDLGLQNIVTAIDPDTGDKTINTALYPVDERIRMVCPHGAGAKNYPPASWDAANNLLYIPLNEACMDLYPVPGGGTGGMSSGVNWGIRPRPDDDGNYGRVQALNLITGEAEWIARQRAPQTSGVLATAGNLVFAASFDRKLHAYDKESGDILWEARLNDVSSSSPISFAVNGKQYIAIVTGEGGFHARSFAPLVPEIQSPPNRGAAVWVFALP